MTRTIAMLAFAAILAGCTNTPPQSIVVSGNGKCHPSQALPAHKEVKPVPVTDTKIDPLYDIFVDERRAHGDDVSDYNTLWQECVGKGTVQSTGVAK